MYEIYFSFIIVKQKGFFCIYCTTSISRSVVLKQYISNSLTERNSIF